MLFVLTPLLQSSPLFLIPNPSSFCSSGNHAGALALAAKYRGIPAHIVMPTDSPTVKKNAVLEYGGQLYLCEPTLAARQQLCEQIQQQTGAVFIPPYNYPAVMAGQGTVALEFLKQV